MGRILSHPSYLPLFWAAILFNNNTAAAQSGRLVHDTLYSKSLQNTVTSESARRSVTVYLPASYELDRRKRYAVVYLLHGIMDTDQTWMLEKNASAWGPWNILHLLNSGIAEGFFGEMIVVMPDERTKAGGSYYTNSRVTGNWEDFTARDLVSYVDGKYRTLTKQGSRGIAGHSMGGYGAITIGMKHPDVFSVVYAMNPAILGWAGDLSIENPAFKKILHVSTYEELMNGSFYLPAIVTLGQAFSPNPDRPPFYVDLPFEMRDGTLVPAEPAFTSWSDHYPATMVYRYQENIRRLRALRFDSAWEDEYTHIPPTTRQLAHNLTTLGIEYTYEEYNGNHRNRLWGRNGRLANEVFPYFWRLLEH